jgi:hypothetical protein
MKKSNDVPKMLSCRSGQSFNLTNLGQTVLAVKRVQSRVSASYTGFDLSQYIITKEKVLDTRELSARQDRRVCCYPC